MFQIRFDYFHLADYLTQDAAPEVNPPHKSPKDKLVSAILSYCKDNDWMILESLSDKEIFGVAAVIVFLKNAGMRSQQDLKNMMRSEQQRALIALNHSKTNIPVWRLSQLSNASLVQMGMLWYANIEFSLKGLLPLFGVSTDQLSDSAAWDKVRQLLSEYSNEPISNFQNVQFAVLLGKLGIVAFLLRWNQKQEQLKALSTAAQRGILVKENYLRTGIPYALLNYQITDPNISYDGETTVSPIVYKRCAPFSEEELVKIGLAWYVIDKPQVTYKEVSWVLTHDAGTGDKQYTLTDAYRDQNRNIEEQLGSGVRAVRISANLAGQIAHSSALFGSLSNFLGRIATFLKNNPNEIITIVDESTDCSSNWDDYADQLGEYLFYPKDSNSKHNLPPDWPTAANIAAGFWPTISDMITYGCRVVVLSNHDCDDRYPWRLHSYDGGASDFIISMDRDDYGLDEAYDYRPACFDVKNSNHQRFNAKANLYVLNHYFYTHSGSFNTSSRHFTRCWGNSELIIEYAMLAWYQTKRKPNFLHVDFYDLPAIFSNYVFDLANALNRPEAYGPFEIPDQINARKSIVVAKSGLRLGKVYNISAVEKITDEENNTFMVSLSRESDTDGAAIVLAKTDPSDPKQQWRLVYNTPQTGLALVTPDGQFALYDMDWGNSSQSVPSAQSRLILKAISNDNNNIALSDIWQGTGFGLQIASGSDQLILYKSNMFVGDNLIHINPNKFTQPLSVWQLIGNHWKTNLNNLTLNRMAAETPVGDYSNQLWIFTPVDSTPTGDGWTLYRDTTYIDGAGTSFTLPDEYSQDHDEGWGDIDRPTIEQMKAFCKAIPQLTSFCYNNGSDATFASDMSTQLGSASGENTYVMDGYKET